MNKELQMLFEQDQADRSVFFEQLDQEQLQIELRLQRTGGASTRSHPTGQSICHPHQDLRASFNAPVSASRRWVLCGWRTGGSQ
jgi:hypothetical protein